MSSLPSHTLRRLQRFLILTLSTILIIISLSLPTTAKPTDLTLIQQGKTQYQQGQIPQAISLWQQAADSAARQSDRIHQATALSYLAQAYQQLSAWDQANPAINSSLELLKQNKDGDPSDRLAILAEAQTIQGSLQLDQGKSAEAYASWQESEKTFQQIGDRSGLLRSQINQSQALVALGHYNQANLLLKAQSEKLPPDDTLKLAFLLNYGEILRLIGHLQPNPQPKTNKPTPNAITILNQGLQLAQQLNTPNDITTAQISLGNTYRAIYQQQQQRLKNQHDKKAEILTYRQKALEYYQQAAQSTNSPTQKIQALSNQQSLPTTDANSPEPNSTIATEIQTQLDRLPLNHSTLYTRIQVADNLIKGENFRQSIPILETTIKMAESLGDRAAESYALGYLGQAYEKQIPNGNAAQLTTQALDFTTKALGIAKELNAREIAYHWLWQLGRLEQTKNPEQAVRSYYAAYITLRNLRQDLGAENSDLQASFREGPIESVYREFTDLLLQPQIADENREGDSRRENNLAKFDPDKESYPVRDEIKSPIKDSSRPDKSPPKKSLRVAHRIDKITNQAKYDSKPLQYPLDAARRVIQDLQSTELANFLQTPCAPSNIEAIDTQVDVENSHTATIYPILLNDRIEVIARFPNQQLRHYKSPIFKKDVQDKIRQFQRDLEESYTFDAVKSEGQEIYQWLIPEPIQAQLEKDKIDTIVFALDGPLRNIPMAALYDGKNYLIEKYAVAVTLDLELKDLKPFPQGPLTVLAASLTKPPLEFQDSFSDLTYVEKEIDAIQQIAGVNVTRIPSEQFTFDNFNEKFSNSPFKIVHLATHGQFSSNPEENFILTAAGKQKNGKVQLSDFDKMFRTRELNRPEPIDLLILSACETASGDDRATLGIAGAAVKAGARSTIASLWSLDDESSQVFMTAFYKALAPETSPAKALQQALTQPRPSRAKALQQAQKELLAQEEYTHPRYWAPFILVGNWL
jgi:CHAT domain-containing protein/tetratricopeptide (TPR) repeat protein